MRFTIPELRNMIEHWIERCFLPRTKFTSRDVQIVAHNQLADDHRSYTIRQLNHALRGLSAQGKIALLQRGNGGNIAATYSAGPRTAS